jgi:hypothetical protein
MGSQLGGVARVKGDPYEGAFWRQNLLNQAQNWAYNWCGREDLNLHGCYPTRS